MPDKKINFEGADIHYRIIGKGTPVVLIHGFAEDSAIWDKQVEALKEEYSLILPDLPGTGASQLLSKANVLLEDHAACINALLEAEHIERCVMIGHSMGGYITLAFAERYPERLSSFLLFHSSAYADDAAKVATRKKGIAFVKKNGAAAFLKATIPGLFYDIGKNKDAMDELIDKGTAFTAEALIQYYTAMINRPERTDVLRNFTGKTGFIMGEHDKAVPFSQSLQQSHLPELSYLYVLRHSAHMGMLEESDKVNDILSIFLQNK